MNIIKRELYEVENDCNMDAIYSKFNELTGLNLEFEVSQEYGTSCYGIIGFNREYYPTLKELEEKIEKHKNGTLGKYEYIHECNVVDYLRRKGILPEGDLLFDVDY